MTQFNPENKTELTYDECLGPAMKITDPKDAQQYFKAYIAWIRKAIDRDKPDHGMTAKQVAKSNLGYYTGYYDHETRLRVEKLFMCAHPIFGKASSGKPLTPMEAFEIGKKLGEKHQL